jgi:DNA-binding FadR family transcriptional regulator
MENAPPARPAELAVSRVRPAYQQIADQLRDLILTGVLAPGDRLPSEGALSGNFGVSRSTVREALRVLASRDLVVTTRGTTGGTFVAKVERSQVSEYLATSIGRLSGDGLTVREILEARELLEVPAAGLAASRRTMEDLAAIEEALAHEEGERARGVRFSEHRQFHSLLIAAAGNDLLDLMTEPVFRVLQGRFLRPGVDAGFWHAVEDDHREIARYVAAGDSHGAERAMGEHLRRLRGAYES